MMALPQTQGISRSEDARWQHPEIPSGASGVLRLRGEIFDTPAPGELPAGLPGLADLHDGGAGFKHIAQADCGLVRARDSEVLAKGTQRQAGHG
jgi:hypothetical protein